MTKPHVDELTLGDWFIVALKKRGKVTDARNTMRQINEVTDELKETKVKTSSLHQVTSNPNTSSTST